MSNIFMKINNWIIVHHTAVSRDLNKEQFDAVDKYHRSKGWGKIGYHWFIEPDGKIKKGRDESQVGAHTKQKMMNYRSIGICLAGNFDVEYPTEKQKMQAFNLIKKLQEKYNIPDKNVVPHRHFAPKSCWGNHLPSDVLGYLSLPEPDQQPSSWAKEAWDKAVDKKIMTKDPLKNATKQEIAVILDRLNLL